MNVLAFDTCLGAVSVAARWRDPTGTWQLRELSEERRSGHAERLMPMLSEALAAAGLRIGDIDRFAVTVGPGTFTGVRVGVAAARALALASGRPVVGMTSLAAIAHGAAAAIGTAHAHACVVVAVDAQRDMAYGQLFDAALAPLGEAVLLRPADLAARVGARPVVVAGSGAEATAAELVRGGGTVAACLPRLMPSARLLAEQAPGLDLMHPVRPLYLRPPDIKPQGDKSLLRAAP
jgi:tRNA threonylcarbamoyladenosine biosynthesis protein TsaB